MATVNDMTVNKRYRFFTTVILKLMGLDGRLHSLRSLGDNIGVTTIFDNKLGILPQGVALFHSRKDNEKGHVVSNSTLIHSLHLRTLDAFAWLLL